MDDLKSIELLMNNQTSIVKTPREKKYKCPYCIERFERKKLPIHIQNKHEEMIPEGYTALRIAFNTINNKTTGYCIICRKESDWNENKGRYERLCNNPQCHAKYKQMVAERNKSKYGTERLQTDARYAAEVQKKALAGRKISGVYKFTDGGQISYVGSYEKQLLEFMDTVMHCKSEDIAAPGPSIEYYLNGEKHLYLPDFFYVPYQLLIEIKDGGDNPNNHPHRIEEEKKNKAKEEAVKRLDRYSYVRVVNNDFSQLLTVMAMIKYNMIDNDSNPIIMSHESALKESLEEIDIDQKFIGSDKQSAIINLNNILNDFNYGIIVNGKAITEHIPYDKYRTISYEDFLKYQTGTCWDYTHFESIYFLKNLGMKLTKMKMVIVLLIHG